MAYIGKNPRFDSTILTDITTTTPVNPASNSHKLINRNGSLFLRDSSGGESQVGGGSGVGEINYISNFDAEGGNTTGWATYADAAGATPVDGTGGSANITFTNQNSVVLRGTRTFKITKDAANRQGQGASYDFTIKEQDISKKLKIQFDFKTDEDAAYASGYLAVYIYDITNSTLITPVDTSISRGTNIFQTSFNSTTSTSYRLIFHIATTNASAWDAYIDNVIVGPGMTSQGAALGGWESYTPSNTQGFGTITSRLQWRRVGENVEIKGDFNLGTVSGSEGQLELPNSYTVNFKSATGSQVVGYAERDLASQSIRKHVALATHGDTYLNFGRMLDGSATANDNPLLPQSGSWLGNASDRISIFASIPVLEFQGKGIVPMLAEDNLSQWQVISDTSVTNLTTNIAAQGGHFKRVGEDLLVRGQLEFNGTNTQGGIFPIIPEGKTVDTDKLAVSGISTGNQDRHIIGTWLMRDNSAGVNYGGSIQYDISGGNVFLVPSDGAYNVADPSTNAPFTIASGDIVSWQFRVPVVEFAGSQNSLVGYSEASESNLGLIKKVNGQIRLDSGSGHGSTNTTIRRFTNVTNSSGSSMTLTQSSTNGDSITINEDGVYSISYTDRVTTSSGQHGISVNASALSGVSGRINNLAASERGISTYTLTTANNCSVTLRLSASDVIRAQTDGFGNESTGGEVQFVITQIAKL